MANYKGYALSLSGSKYVRADSSSLNSKIVDKATIEAWYKTGSSLGSSTPICGLQQNSGARWIFTFREVSNRLGFDCLTSDGTQTRLTSSITVYPNTMYHLSATYDGNLITFYINGEIVATSSKTGTIVDSTFAFVGQDYGGTASPTGVIDEFRIWNTVKTQNEIKEKMKRELYTPNDLLLYWKMNDGIGTTVKDSSLSGLNGTITNLTGVEWIPSEFGVAPLNKILILSSNGDVVSTENDGVNNNMVYVPDSSEQNFINHGLDKGTEIDLNAEMTNKVFIEQSSTPLGEGKVFKTAIDTSQMAIKKVEVK